MASSPMITTPLPYCPMLSVARYFFVENDLMPKALLLANRHSRRGDSPELQEACDLLEESGVTLIRAAAEKSANTDEIIAAHKDEIDRVIVAGGDGSLNSVAGSLHQHGLTLAILPLGTANDLARTLGIPDDLNKACRIIIEGHCQWVDLGMVNGHYYFNVANMGLGTKITGELTPEVKKHWGVFSYLKALLAALSHRRSFRLKINVDGVDYKMQSMHVTVGNGRYYGGGNLVHENARIDDGKLTLYSLKPLTFLQLLTLSPLLRTGAHHQSEQVFNIQGKNISIQTSRRLEVHADGEYLTDTPAQCQSVHRALQIIVPRPKGGDEEI